MNVVWKVGLWLFMPFMISCTEAIPEGLFEGSLGGTPSLKNNVTNIIAMDVGAVRAVQIPGVCDQLISGIELSLDDSTWFEADGSDLGCGDGSFSIDLRLNGASPDPERLDLVLNTLSPGQSTVFYFRGITYLGTSTASTPVTVIYQPSGPTVSFPAAAFTGSESQGSQEIDLKLSMASFDPVYISFDANTTPDQASAADYSGFPASVTIPAISLTASFSFIVFNDNFYDGDEYFDISMLSVTNGVGSGPANFMITDDEVAPSVRFGTATVTSIESIGSVNHEIITSGPSERNIVVTFASSGTAVRGSFDDYDVPTMSATIPGMSTVAWFSATINDDTVTETDETYVLTLTGTNVPAVTVGSPSTVTHTLQDNDGTSVWNFLAASSAPAESVGTHQIVVSLMPSPTSLKTITYTVTEFTASGGGTDYTLASGTITVSPGQTMATLSALIVDDLIDENDEDFSVILSGPSAGTSLGGISSHTVSVIDNDSTPVVNFNLTSTSANENVGSHSVTVSLSNPSASTVTVSYSTSGGLAAPAIDYTYTSNTLTFASGETTKTILVPILDDVISELTEDFNLTLSGPVNGILGAVVVQTINIIDNEGLPVLNFTSSVGSTNETTTTGSISLTLGNASSSDITFAYTVANGTAMSGIDFTFASGTGTIAAGQTVFTMTPVILDDAITEGAETFTITLSSPSANAALGGTTMYTHTINDNESAPVLNFVSANSSENENVGPTNIVLSLSGASATDVVFTLTRSGTATLTTDYTDLGLTYTITAGQTVRTITSTIVDDPLGEPAETIIYDIATVSGGATEGTPGTHTLTINASDTPTLQFAATTSSEPEELTTKNIIVTLSNAASANVTANYAIAGSTTATSPADYTFTAGTLTFAAGTTLHTLTANIVEDSIYENPDEFLDLNLSAVSGNAVIGTNTDHRLTITDDDGVPTLYFSLAATAAAENVTPHDIVLTLSHASSASIQVTFSVANLTTEVTDYTIASTTHTIAANSVLHTVPVAITNDAVYEGDETFTLTLLTASGGTELGSTSIHSHTINDDEAPAVVNFASATTSGSEATTPHNIVVNLNRVTEANVIVSYTVAAGTATGSGVDYTLSNGALTFTAGSMASTIQPVIINDSLFEGPESFGITLTSTSANAALGGTTMYTHTINDNESAPVLNFVSANSSENENVGPTNIVLSLSGASATDVVFTLTRSGTATLTTDYTDSGLTYTMTTGQTVRTITSTIVDDPLGEPAETIIYDIATVSGGATEGTPGTHTLTINASDTPTLQFAATTSSEPEELTTKNIIVTLSNAASANVTANYAIAGSTTATSPADYTFSAGTLTFAAGTTMYTLTANIVEDSIYENPDEFIDLTLSAVSANAVIGTNTAHRLSITDDDGVPSLARITQAATVEGQSLQFVVNLDQPQASGFSMNWNLNSPGPNPASNSDLTGGLPASGSVSFGPAQVSATISLGTDDDIFNEGTETVEIVLSNASSAIVDPDFDVATGYIFDNEYIYPWPSGVNNIVNASTSNPSDGLRLLGGSFSRYDTTINSGIYLGSSANGNEVPGFFSGSGFTGNANRVVTQADGKIIVGGSFTKYNGVVANNLVRLNVDGSLDTSFMLNIGSGPNNAVTALAVDGAGRILVAGSFTSFNGSARFSIVRLLQNGNMDFSFSSPTTPSDPVSAMAFDSTGRIYVGGQFTSWNGSGLDVLARLYDNGSTDLSFANATFGGSNNIMAMAVNTSGKVLVGGLFTMPFSNFGQFNSDGTVDTTFMSNLGTAPNSFVSTIKVLPNQSILVGGGFTGFVGSLGGLVRINPSGTKDTSFSASLGSGYSNNGSAGWVYDVLPLNNGKLAVVGQFTGVIDNTLGNKSSNIVLLDSNGNVDTKIPEGLDKSAYKIALSYRGDIVAVGDFKSANGNIVNNLVAVDANGAFDSVFNTNLLSSVTFLTTSQVHSLKYVPSPVNAYFVGGDFNSPRNLVLKVQTDGTLNASFNPSWLPATGQVRAIEYIASSSALVVGGSITNDNPMNIRGLDQSSGSSISMNNNPRLGSGANGQVYSIVETGSSGFVIGGDFTMFDGVDYKRIVKRNSNGSGNTTFAVSGGTTNDGFSQGTVVALAYDGMSVYAGVSHSGNTSITFEGNSIGRLVKMNASDATSVTNFPSIAGPETSVTGISIVDSTHMYVTGKFTNYGGNLVNGFVRMTDAGLFQSSYGMDVQDSGFPASCVNAMYFSGFYRVSLCGNEIRQTLAPFLNQGFRLIQE